MNIDTVRWINSNGEIFARFIETSNLMPGKLRLIDQTRLPEELVYVETDDISEIFDFIRRLVVRGAPAIGCAAALGLAAVSQKSKAITKADFLCEVRKSAEFLAKSRPTAVNLFWALDRSVKSVANSNENDVSALKFALLREALDILDEDISMCRMIGEHGAKLLQAGMRILTHCNAGALATGGYGTALAPIYVAKEKGISVKVYADETRPLLQGSRLTAWELNRAGIEVTVICDNMAGWLMRKKMIDIVITGADRIARNGDSANKIGTYSVATLANAHNIPFYIAAPYSTIDFNIEDGLQIPIEERAGEEIIKGFGKLTAPQNITTFNPAFDVTPASLISGIITEKGILAPPYSKSINSLYRK